MLHRNISKDWERGWDYSEGMHLGRPQGASKMTGAISGMMKVLVFLTSSCPDDADH